MGDIWKPASAGERRRIPASLYNEWLKVGRQLETQFRSQAGEFVRQSGVVKVRNDSGAERDEFELLGIDGVAITPAENLDEFKREVFFKGVTPAAGHAGKFVVLLDPAAPGAIVDAVASGVAAVRMDSSGSFADVVAGDATKLRGASSGARVLWSDSGTSTRWAVVRLGEVEQAAAAALVNGTAVTVNGSGSVSAMWNGALYDTGPFQHGSLPTAEVSARQRGLYRLETSVRLVTWPAASAGGFTVRFEGAVLGVANWGQGIVLAATSASYELTLAATLLLEPLVPVHVRYYYDHAADVAIEPRVLAITRVPGAI